MEALALVAIGFVGTVFWVISPEAAAAVYASQRGWPALTVGLLAGAGQGAAHLVLYATGDQLRRRWRWFDRKCQRAVLRYGGWLSRGAIPLGCLSGLLGIPPSSVTAALAPGLRLPAKLLLPLLLAMRVIRLTVVALIAGRVGPIIGH
jgi:hypothetical protein